MEWSDEDGQVFYDAYGAAGRGDAGRRAVASRAVELAAARGGTMTAHQAELKLGYLTRDVGTLAVVEELRQHLSAQGDRVAVLEQERDTLSQRLTETNQRAQENWEKHEAERERLHAAVVEAQRQRDAALEHVDDLEKSLENARKERDQLQSEKDSLTQAYTDVLDERDAALAANDAMREPMRLLREAVDMPAQGEGTVVAEVLRRLTSALADNAALIIAYKKGDRFAGDMLWAMESDPAHHPGAALLEELQKLRFERSAHPGVSCHAVESALRAKEDLVGRVHALLDGGTPRIGTIEGKITILKEQHSKALVRARNEGLEKAAQGADDAADEAERRAEAASASPDHDAANWDNGAANEARNIATRIRAMREPEPH